MGELEGSVALVTGAGTGIGRETTRLLAAAGAEVVLAGRREAPLAAVTAAVTEAGGRAWYRSADMEDASSVEALAAACLERHGRVDILVHNAGHSSKVRSARWISDDEWSSVLAVNVTGPMILTRALLPAMLEAGAGTVIMVSSMAALRPGVMAGTAYGTAKAAARNYMAGLAAELRQKGIRATTVMPGEVDTPILDNRPLPPSEEQRAGMMQAEDVARAILLAATLPQRTVIEEMTMMPTRLRDFSAD
ncbi:MAG: SDR family oxidoreductase, partial [Thermoanaerobaculia bacterium]|nr:SDR family oxidoreductase [Thermoanaerobaculia bacterium]